MAYGNLEDLIGAGSLRAIMVVTPPSTRMALGSFESASLMTMTLTSSPLPGISLSIIDDDHPKISMLPVAKGPDLKYIPSSSNLDSCSLLPEDFGELKDIWKQCLIGYYFGKPPRYTIIGKFMAHRSIHYLRSIAGFKTNDSFFYFCKPNLSSAPVWVRFPNLSLEFLSQACLSKISSIIGKPIRRDAPTNSMSRVSFARFFIEVDLCMDLPPSSNISMPYGITINQKVIYESLPKICPQCYKLGHSGATYLNLGARPKDLPTPVLAKHMHVSSTGPSETMANVKPVLCPPLGFYTMATTVTRTWEANRRRKKAKLPGDAIFDLHVLPSNLADSSGSDFFGNKKLGSPSSTIKDRSLPKCARLMPQGTPIILSDATLGTSNRKKQGNLWMITPPLGFF
ncbi:hypothetical protein NC652_022232 [Populus alba x Populus x berolinensis]|nr:hypothetical protein NC652_022232 [Populus alba x Populus x berolinensis]